MIRPFSAALACLAAVSVSYGLGNSSYSDNVPASSNPPKNLKASQVPQFIVLSFDDNSMAGSSETGGMVWLLDLLKDRKNPKGTSNPKTFDGTPVRGTFLTFACGYYEELEDEPVELMRAVNRAYAEGHEIGNHSYTHATGNGTALSGWEKEIDQTDSAFARKLPPDSIKSMWDLENPAAFKKFGSAVDLDSVEGWRTPRLAYNTETFKALKSKGFTYDCSIEDGWEESFDGSNYVWPYTLDGGSEGSNYTDGWDPEGHGKLESVPGIWEIPTHPFLTPPGLGTKLLAADPKLDDTTKITGLDYNVFASVNNGGFGLSADEYLAILKHSLDVHLAGNRAPFMIGAHSQFTHDKKIAEEGFKASGPEIRKAWSDFIDYALQKPEVRIVRGKDLIAWMRNPAALDGSTSLTNSRMPIQSTITCSGRELTIGGLTETAELSLYSLSGELIMKRTVSPQNCVVSTKETASGTYCVQISGKNSFSGKIVIE